MIASATSIRHCGRSAVPQAGLCRSSIRTACPTSNVTREPTAAAAAVRRQAQQQERQRQQPQLLHGRRRCGHGAAGRGVSCGALISYVEVAAGSDTPDDLAVEVHPTEAAVGARICELAVHAAQAAVAQRGYFFLAIPGGSVLKMCGGLVGKQMPWDRTFLFYVNHKCVPLGDKSSTHQKALDLFLTRVGAPLANVAALKGSSDAVAEAHEYESRLRQIAVQRGMDLTADVVPRFDLMLLGMGADGHVGSLYPGRSEPSLTGPGAPLVMPVDKKQPPSITLSLPVMNAAKQVVIAMTGAGKADAVRSALQSLAPGGDPSDLPARRVRPVEGGSALWLMDAPAASKLDVAVGARTLLAADHAARAL